MGLSNVDCGFAGRSFQATPSRKNQHRLLEFWGRHAAPAASALYRMVTLRLSNSRCAPSTLLTPSVAYTNTAVWEGTWNRRVICQESKRRPGLQRQYPDRSRQDETALHHRRYMHVHRGFRLHGLGGDWAEETHTRHMHQPEPDIAVRWDIRTCCHRSLRTIMTNVAMSSHVKSDTQR